ncbi:MAG: helix-hairpin-helix domain-containing protein [Bacteroidales bacterium]|jgi:DNA uptake protein ComE-like DNA-binding protein|nr:helix-hairpin-helix domain-containing protein [Bacteroidales bacterium]
MMKRFSFEPIRDWFGYTRRERRSSFFLLLIIAVVAGIRFVVPSKEGPVEMVIFELPEISHDTINRKKPESASQNYTSKPNRQMIFQAIELNTCDSAALEALPGIGPVLSARIIKYRNLLGGYWSVEQLKEVYGLSEETFNLVKKRVSADAGLVRKININSADYKQLMNLRYLERDDIQAILKYRELMGRIKDIEELVKNKILTEEKAEELKWYLEY